ncbi:histidinol-phosphate transaminase [Sporosarcina highlanderae]|uniref:Histidinol-phosphate aminotransferase n=1 Tax=Sporosarcina highlanderae TaxID=3035916 RepID=A0ABT8JWL9_9BACL|nr:histidinol-phosphate transaminase [Sporosarcina highlanderae]MDN4608732.1 histidinol-phosphate transaminase [Sporosarcina highlanderae]
MKWKEALNEMNPYKPGRSIEEVKDLYSLKEVVKLASNENPYGCASSVMEFLTSSSMPFQIYPDGHATNLRSELSEKHGVDEGSILFGNGSDEIISIISRALLDNQTHTIMPAPTFPQYAHNAKIEGADFTEIPLSDGGHDLDAFLSAINERTSVIWICNPNNPTGNLIPSDELKRFLSKVPENILVVLDEAYFEYVTDPNNIDSIRLVDDYPNILVLRTFSKAYGLASFRLGYAVGSPTVVTELNKVRNPFNNNSLALAMASVALKDDEFIEECRRKNEIQRGRYKDFASENKIHIFDSQTNFVLMEVPCDADEATEFLLQKGYIVRSGNALGTPNYVRITIGTEEQNTGVFHALDLLLKEKGR